MPLLRDYIVDRLWTIVTDPGFPSRRGAVVFSAPGSERRGRGAYRRRGPAVQRAGDGTLEAKRATGAGAYPLEALQ